MRVLADYPQLVATEPGQPTRPGTDGSFFSDNVSANMPPGGTTYVGLETDSYCSAHSDGGGTGPIYDHIEIAMPGGGVSVLRLGPDYALDLKCGLHLARYYVPQPAVVVHDPRTDLQVRLVTPAHISAGHTLIYLAELTNPTAQPITLDPCPSYLASELAPPLVKDEHQLDCTVVNVIAARSTVRYEMRTSVPSGTPAGLWTLNWYLTFYNGPHGSSTVLVTR